MRNIFVYMDEHIIFLCVASNSLNMSIEKSFENYANFIQNHISCEFIFLSNSGWAGNKRVFFLSKLQSDTFLIVNVFFCILSRQKLLFFL